MNVDRRYLLRVADSHQIQPIGEPPRTVCGVWQEPDEYVVREFSPSGEWVKLSCVRLGIDTWHSTRCVQVVEALCNWRKTVEPV